MGRFKLSRPNIKEPEICNSFANGLNFYKLFWIFVFGCVVGYAVEMLWSYIFLGYFESRRGLIYGPFSPVYGFGAVIFTLLLHKLEKSNGIVIFSLSALIGGIFEYLCSWFQEFTVDTISWEYSELPLSLKGRTNLGYSILWGVMGLIFIKYIYPHFSKLVESIPNMPGLIITWFMIIFMTFNILISLAAVKRYSERANRVPPSGSFDVFLDQKYPDDFMKEIFPNMIILYEGQ